MNQIDGLVQDCSNSHALAMELLQSCTKPSKYSTLLYQTPFYTSRMGEIMLRMGEDFYNNIEIIACYLSKLIFGWVPWKVCAEHCSNAEITP